MNRGYECEYCSNQLAADTNDIVLDKLNEIATGPLMVNLEASQTEFISENQESH